LSLKLLLAGTSQVVIDWPVSTDNVGVTGYRIFRDSALITTVQTTYYLDSGLVPGSTHTYQVRAVDAAGNQSAASPSLTAKAASLVTGSTGSLSGVVFNQTGKLLQNAVASLTLSTGTVKTAKSNRNGVWKISSLPAGTYQVAVNLSGYRTQTLTMTAAAGQTLIAATELAP
jgi:cellulose 1,4-beta-cellobiosidase